MKESKIITAESEHGETDLYDGFIMSAMKKGSYFDNLNPDILKEILNKLNHYIDVMSYIDRPDADPYKNLEAHGLSEKLGLKFIYLDGVLNGMKERIETLLKRSDIENKSHEKLVDFHDNLIIEAFKKPELFHDLNKEDLKIIKSRLEKYSEIVGDESRYDEAEELQDRLGFYLSRGTLRDLLEVCEFLLGEGE